MERLLLRVPEAAEIMGLSKSKVYDLIARGIVPSIKVGKSVRVPYLELQQWIRQRISQI